MGYINSYIDFEIITSTSYQDIVADDIKQWLDKNFYQKYKKQLPTCLNLNINKSKQQLHVILNDPIINITAANQENNKENQ